MHASRLYWVAFSIWLSIPLVVVNVDTGFAGEGFYDDFSDKNYADGDPQTWSSSVLYPNTSPNPRRLSFHALASRACSPGNGRRASFPELDPFTKNYLTPTPVARRFLVVPRDRRTSLFGKVGN